jgi:hypothetical protein
MKRLAIYLGILLQIFVLSSIPAFAAPAATTTAPDSPASLMTKGLAQSNADAGYTAIPVPVLVGRMIQILLGLTGIIFLVIIVYAGIIYMISSGDATKVDKAKKMMTQAVIGLILIVGAYSISTFVITQLQGAV